MLMVRIQTLGDDVVLRFLRYPTNAPFTGPGTKIRAFFIFYVSNRLLDKDRQQYREVAPLASLCG